MSAPRPPRPLEALVARVTAAAPDADALLGDLAEGFAHQVGRHGRVRAVLWYARQGLSLLRHRGGLAGSPPGSSRAARWEGLRRDLWHAARSGRRHPGHALAVVGLLAGSIGAGTAALSVTVGTMEAARWWEDAERTLQIWPENSFSRGQLDVLRTESTAFTAVGGILRRPLLVTWGDRTISTPAVLLSPELFGALRAAPRTGRGLLPEDALPGAEPVAVLGDALWRSGFGGDPEVVGRTVEMGGVRRRVVGIMPPAAQQPGPGTQVWTPLVLDPQDPDFWPARELEVVGISRPGVDERTARDDVRRVMADLARRFSFFFRPDFGSDATVILADARTWGAVATPLLLLLAGTVLLLLVAAIDVGHLALARSLDRSAEMRVRASLGATRRGIVQQMAAEAALYALGGAVAGWGVGILLAPAITDLFPAGTPVASAGAVQPWVLLFGAAAGVLAWLLMTAVPALHFLTATRADLVPRRGRRRSAHGVVVAQAALSTVLLVLAALLFRTVDGLRNVPLGFTPSEVSAVPVNPAATVLPPGVVDARRDAVREAVLGATGARAAGWLSTVPFQDIPLRDPVHTDMDNLQVAGAPTAVRLVADAGALEALGTRVLEGRAFTPLDAADAPPVALINQALARLLWEDGAALGRRIAVDPHAWTRWIEVVGVVEDMQLTDLASAPPPAFYLPRGQADAAVMALVIDGSPGAAAAAAAVRTVLADIAPGVAVGRGAELDDLVRDAQGQARVLTALLGLLAVLATALGAAGLYAALASWVSRRQGEIGTRLALGASPWRLSSSVLGTGVTLTAGGVLLGSLAAVLAGRAVRGLLFGVSPLDPLAFAVPGVLLLTTGVLAAAVPAWRAARIPPSEALKGSMPS